MNISNQERILIARETLLHIVDGYLKNIHTHNIIDDEELGTIDVEQMYNLMLLCIKNENETLKWSNSTVDKAMEMDF